MAISDVECQRDSHVTSILAMTSVMFFNTPIVGSTFRAAGVDSYCYLGKAEYIDGTSVDFPFATRKLLGHSQILTFTAPATTDWLYCEVG